MYLQMNVPPSRQPVGPVADPWEQPTRELIARLCRSGAGNKAPRIGAAFPDFALADSHGQHVRLAQLIEQGPVVLSFLRGRWCPYCARELQMWHDAMPRLEAAGASFVAISAEAGGRAEEFRRDIAPAATMLCDIDHGLAMLLGLAFPMGEGLHQRYIEAGLDLGAVYGNSGRILPITATYVIDCGGIVRYAHIDPDFRVRADPNVVIAVVEGINRQGHSGPRPTPTPGRG